MVVIAIFRVIKAPFIDGNLSIIDCYAEAVHVFRNFVHVIKNRLVGAPVHVIEKTVHVHENCCSRVLRILIREYKLRQLLDDAFGRDAGFILDLAAYMIVSEDNAAQYYPDYARRHPLFTEGMSVKSDSSVSRLLSRMGRDQITAFLDAWNARQDHRHRIYISYDSTNKNSHQGIQASAVT